MLKNASTSSDSSFVGLKLEKGKEFYAKGGDSGERGGAVQESRKDNVPNPEAGLNQPGVPGKRSYKGGV
jgi:hypothetical protein